jgi:hypothetical protein
MVAVSVIFQKLPKANNRIAHWAKIAQSGHPVQNLTARLMAFVTRQRYCLEN